MEERHPFKSTSLLQTAMLQLMRMGKTPDEMRAPIDANGRPRTEDRYPESEVVLYENFVERIIDRSKRNERWRNGSKAAVESFQQYIRDRRIIENLTKNFFRSLMGINSDNFYSTTFWEYLTWITKKKKKNLFTGKYSEEWTKIRTDTRTTLGQHEIPEGELVNVFQQKVKNEVNTWVQQNRRLMEELFDEMYGRIRDVLEQEQAP
tara:strand:+ start:182 stop:799 length:618 start_codon:yes stop_codon:yes gene_type:complete